MATYTAPAVNVDLSVALAKGMADEIWAIRGKAIQAYGNLETAFCQLFAHLSGMQLDTASIIFFKITSQDVRNKIIEKLLRKKVEPKYITCIANALGKIRTLDIQRNEIIHWNAVAKVIAKEGVEPEVTVFLQPPATFTNPQGAAERSSKDLIDFTYACSFYSRLFNMFSVVMFHVKEDTPSFQRQPWLDIFQQQVAYPPPATHLLCQSREELHSLLQSFVMSA